MTKQQTLLQQLFNGLLILAVIILLGVLSVRYKAEIDWTANNRNTLTEASIKQLAAMPDRLTFFVFAPSGADIRRAVETDLAKYRRAKPDLAVEFIDPSVSPQKVREYNIDYIGQVVVEYQGRRESLNATTETAITTALQRLAYSGEQWVVFLEGHGERATAGTDPAAFGRYASALRAKGLKVQGLNLVKTAKIPDNTSVLVLAAPQSALLEGEIKLVQEYVARGGNLLWLADPDQPAGLAPLAKDLGITWQDGFAILPDYQVLGTGHPGFFAAVEYPSNPVTQGLEQVTLFPLVRSVIATPDSGWQPAPMLQTSPEAWLETGDIASGQVALDGTDIQGPLTIGLTLSREHKGEGAEAKSHTQRVALVGDADFLSDAYLGELGNQALGLNLIQWLASRDAQLNIDVPKAPDQALYLPGWATMLIAIGFILALPLLLIGIGVTRWLLRRRA